MPSIWIIILAVFVIAVLAVVALTASNRRSLRQRFGPEYDRAVAQHDNRTAAEQELRERERRHAELELRPISDDARARYAKEWEKLQLRFVDEPNDAVRDGDDLVTRLVAERGYPTGAGPLPGALR